jgi:AcrR family transcriptional regulator
MPRKPTQKRAMATVEAIVEAGFICVSKRGLEATTTRHIAEAAGIGVGSLYEYFSNKDEIYQLMYERLVGEVGTTIRALVPELVKLPISDAIRRILYSVGALLQQDDRRYLRCARYALQADMKMDMEPLAKLLMEVILQYVMHQPRYMKVRNIPTMNYIFIHGGIYTLMHHLSERNPALSYEALVDGLADMVGHYAEHELALLEGRPTAAP